MDAAPTLPDCNETPAAAFSCSALLACSPWTPLLALDRLNSWLRADLAPTRFWCPVRSALKSTIYWTKTKAILDVSRRWHIGMRRVMVRKPCRSCGGTGLWVPYNYEPPNGDYRSRDGGYPCRGCEATGTATLKFIETTIGPLRWHTPSEQWWSSSLDVYVPFPSFHHAVSSTAGLDAREEALIARILIKLNLYAAFCELTGGSAADVKPQELWDQSVKELKNEGITDEKQIQKLMLEVAKRI